MIISLINKLKKKKKKMIMSHKSTNENGKKRITIKTATLRLKTVKVGLSNKNLKDLAPLLIK